MTSAIKPRRITGIAPELNRLQEVFAQPLDRLARLPLLDGMLIEGQVLTAAAVTKVQHGLGRKPRGWLLARANAETALYDKIDESTTYDLTRVLPIYSANAVTVSLWVF